MTSDEQPRTVLAMLVAQGDQTHEEQVSAFNRRARQMGEPATLSLRQFERWLAGELTSLPRPTARRVAEAHWGRPIQDLLGPPGNAVAIVPQVLSAVTDHDRAEEDDMERRAVLRSVLAASGVGLGTSTTSTCPGAVTIIAFIVKLLSNVGWGFRRRTPLRSIPHHHLVKQSTTCV